MVFLRAWFGFDWVSDGGATLAIDDFVDEPADCNQLVRHKNN